MTAAADALMAIFGFKRVEGKQMKTDRELLELAARAHGSLRYVEGFGYIHDLGDGRNGAWWRPLEDDSDALRLAVKLRMEIDHNYPAGERVLWVSVRASGMQSCEIEEFDKDTDRYAATRRAIVRAAAAIGEGLR